MRVITILGRVLDPKGIAVNRRAGRVFVNRKEYLIQPADRSALEAALQFKDEQEAEVVVLPRSFLPDDDVLRQALALGADRAIHLIGEKAAGEAVMTRALAAAVERLGGADLILMGMATQDTGQSQLGPRLAEALGYPQIMDAWAVRVTQGELETVCRRAGNYTILTSNLPALVTVNSGAFKLRYPDGPRLINIYRGEGEVAERFEVWKAADLVDAEMLAPLLERRGQDFPPERERGVRVGGSLEEMAQTAAEALQQRVRRIQ